MDEKLKKELWPDDPVTPLDKRGKALQVQKATREYQRAADGKFGSGSGSGAGGKPKPKSEVDLSTAGGQEQLDAEIDAELEREGLPRQGTRTRSLKEADQRRAVIRRVIARQPPQMASFGPKE